MTFTDVYSCAREDLAPKPGWILGLQAGALVGSLAGIALFGAWPLLLAYLFLPVTCAATECLKRIYWWRFDPLMWKAADTGRFRTQVAWNALTVFLDWLIGVAGLLAGAALVHAFARDVPLPAPVRWFVLWSCVFPLVRKMPRRSRFLVAPDRALFYVLPFICGMLSFAVRIPLTGVALAALLVMAVAVPLRMRELMPGIRRDFAKWREEARAGRVRDYALPRSWRPRPGVLFEPQYNPYSTVKEEAFLLMRPVLTLLRANCWGFFASLAGLVGGAVWTACLGRPALLFLFPAFLIPGLVYGFMASDIDRRLARTYEPVRGLIMLAPLAACALPAFYLAGRDAVQLSALTLFFASSWFFFAGFLVRETSEAVFDTVEYLVVLAGLAGVVCVRAACPVTWWEASLPALVFCFIYPRIRCRWPRTDLPPARKEDPPAGHAGGRQESPDNKSRRLRKRARQLAALQQSQWRRRPPS